MTSIIHHPERPFRPSSRGLRHLLAAALSVDASSVWTIGKLLARSGAVPEGSTDARTVAMIALGLLASAPTRPLRERGENRAASIIERLRLLASLTPNNTRRTGPLLPFCMRIFEQPNLSLSVALEILVEQSADPNVAQYLKQSFETANAVAHDAIELDFLTSGEYPRALLRIVTSTGSTLELTFARPDDPLTLTADRITLRFGLDARAIMALSRLTLGDTTAEDRFNDSLPHTATPFVRPVPPLVPGVPPPRRRRPRPLSRDVAERLRGGGTS